MEFKFRAVDERPPSFLSPSSTISPFSYQSLPASYSSFVPSPYTGQMGNPNYAREAILRELDKEQIRREIIVAEIARRRMLEEEVRRELMLERELVMRRSMGEELSLEEKIAMRLSPSFPMMHPLNNLPFEERMPFPGNSTMNMFPLPQLLQPAPEIKPPSETNKDKLIILAKPDPDHYGAKRKALEPPAVDGSEHSPFGLKKKPKDEWSCALCHVSATSEKGLNEHLQGRRHKAKEAALSIQKIGLEAKANEQSLHSEVALEDITKKVHYKDVVEIINEEQLVQNKQNAEGTKKQNAKGQGVKRKKKAKFWCEVCKVGAPSHIVMESHKKGRKHMARMLTFTKNKETSETTQLTKNTDAANVLTKETNMKMADNFAYSGNPSVSPVAENSDKSFVSPVAESSGDKAAEELQVLELPGLPIQNVI